MDYQRIRRRHSPRWCGSITPDCPARSGLGITGFFVPYVLWVNAQGLGISAALMHKYDELAPSLHSSHPRLMELTAIFIAGAAGLPGPGCPGASHASAVAGLWGRQLIWGPVCWGTADLDLWKVW